MYVFFTFFYVFFKIQKNMTFYVFLSCCTRFPEQCGTMLRCSVAQTADAVTSDSRFALQTLVTTSGGTAGEVAHMTVRWKQSAVP